jgi:hypothetical protein
MCLCLKTVKRKIKMKMEDDAAPSAVRTETGNNLLIPTRASSIPPSEFAWCHQRARLPSPEQGIKLQTLLFFGLKGTRGGTQGDALDILGSSSRSSRKMMENFVDKKVLDAELMLRGRQRVQRLSLPFLHADAQGATTTAIQSRYALDTFRAASSANAANANAAAASSSASATTTEASTARAPGGGGGGSGDSGSGDVHMQVAAPAAVPVPQASLLRSPPLVATTARNGATGDGRGKATPTTTFREKRVGFIRDYVTQQGLVSMANLKAAVDTEEARASGNVAKKQSIDHRTIKKILNELVEEGHLLRHEVVENQRKIHVIISRTVSDADKDVLLAQFISECRRSGKFKKEKTLDAEAAAKLKKEKMADAEAAEYAPPSSVMQLSVENGQLVGPPGMMPPHSAAGRDLSLSLAEAEAAEALLVENAHAAMMMLAQRQRQAFPLSNPPPPPPMPTTTAAGTATPTRHHRHQGNPRSSSSSSLSSSLFPPPPATPPPANASVSAQETATAQKGPLVAAAAAEEPVLSPLPSRVPPGGPTAAHEGEHGGGGGGAAAGAGGSGGTALRGRGRAVGRAAGRGRSRGRGTATTATKTTFAPKQTNANAKKKGTKVSTTAAASAAKTPAAASASKTQGEGGMGSVSPRSAPTPDYCMVSSRDMKSSSGEGPRDDNLATTTTIHKCPSSETKTTTRSSQNQSAGYRVMNLAALHRAIWVSLNKRKKTAKTRAAPTLFSMMDVFDTITLKQLSAIVNLEDGYKKMLSYDIRFSDLPHEVRTSFTSPGEVKHLNHFVRALLDMKLIRRKDDRITDPLQRGNLAFCTQRRPPNTTTTPAAAAASQLPSEGLASMVRTTSGERDLDSLFSVEYEFVKALQFCTEANSYFFKTLQATRNNKARTTKSPSPTLYSLAVDPQSSAATLHFTDVRAMQDFWSSIRRANLIKRTSILNSGATSSSATPNGEGEGEGEGFVGGGGSSGVTPLKRKRKAGDSGDGATRRTRVTTFFNLEKDIQLLEMFLRLYDEEAQKEAAAQHERERISALDGANDPSARRLQLRPMLWTSSTGAQGKVMEWDKMAQEIGLPARTTKHRLEALLKANPDHLRSKARPHAPELSGVHLFGEDDAILHRQILVKKCRRLATTLDFFGLDQGVYEKHRGYSRTHGFAPSSLPTDNNVPLLPAILQEEVYQILQMLLVPDSEEVCKARRTGKKGRPKKQVSAEQRQASPAMDAALALLHAQFRWVAREKTIFAWRNRVAREHPQTAESIAAAAAAAAAVPEKTYHCFHNYHHYYFSATPIRDALDTATFDYRLSDKFWQALNAPHQIYGLTLFQPPSGTIAPAKDTFPRFGEFYPIADAFSQAASGNLRLQPAAWEIRKAVEGLGAKEKRQNDQLQILSLDIQLHSSNEGVFKEDAITASSTEALPMLVSLDPPFKESPPGAPWTLESGEPNIPVLNSMRISMVSLAMHRPGLSANTLVKCWPFLGLWGPSMISALLCQMERDHLIQTRVFLKQSRETCLSLRDMFVFPAPVIVYTYIHLYAHTDRRT